MINWINVKDSIKNTIKEIQNDSILDTLAQSSLKSIPIVGDLLSDIYNNSKDTPEDKTQQIVQLLETMNNMKEEKLEEFCVELQNNRNSILKNHNFLHEISQDVSLILNKLDNATKERKEIKDSIVTMSGEVSKLYDIVQRLQIREIPKPQIIKNPNTFVSDSFSISYPKTWKEESKEKIFLISQILEKQLENEKLESLPIPSVVIHKKTSEPIQPNVNVIVYPFFDKSLKVLFQNNIEFMEKYGWETIVEHIDEISGIASLQVVQNPYDIPAYMIQKYYLRNNSAYVMTFTCNEGQLEKDPNLLKDVKSIVQSLEFLI